MNPDPHSPDLLAMAQEAEVEIVAAESLVVARTTVVAGTDDGGASSLATAELGYYEAELRSLRDAATGLDAAEHHRQLP